MGQEFVTIRGKKHYVDDGELDLSGKGITDIAEIEGLESLINLRVLYLQRNQIKELKGLENLTNLQELRIDNNPLREDERYLSWINPQEIVKYCQDKKEGNIKQMRLPREIFSILHIEKPVIIIEADAQLIAINGHLLKRINELPDDYDVMKFFYSDEYLAPEPLIIEYLQVKGFEFALPKFTIIPIYDNDNIYVEGVILSYQSELDLPLPLLYDLLKAIEEKLKAIVADLDLHMNVIKKIAVQGYREPSVVIDVLDEIIKYIENTGLENPISKDAIERELIGEGSNGTFTRFLEEVSHKYELLPKEMLEIARLLAEKLDKFRNWFRGIAKGFGLKSVTKKEKETQMDSLFYIEKPMIRIEAEAQLIAINGYLLKTIDQLPTDYENRKFIYSDKYIAPVKMIREYLQVQDFAYALPELAVIPRSEQDFRYIDGVILSYCSEQDLTLLQLDDLLTAIVEKLTSIVADLDLHMSIIKKITVQGYRESSVVIDVLDEIIEYINFTDFVEATIMQELELVTLTDKTDWFLTNVNPQYVSENIWEIVWLLAEKLDKLYVVFKKRKYV